MEGSLSEEVLLRCLSYLPVNDLLVVARVSSAWHRLAQDPQLWRSLYLSTFASSASPSSVPTRTRPWRELYKISTNWRRGNARPSTLGRTMRKSVLAEAPDDLRIAGESTSTAPCARTRDDPSRPTDTLLAFHRQFFLTASRTPTSSPPSITVHQTLLSGESLLIGSFSSPALVDHLASRPPNHKSRLSVTEMRLDDRSSAHDEVVKTLGLAVFYSTGQFSLFRLSLPSTTTAFHAQEVHAHLPISTTGPLFSTYDPIVLARFHLPLLATCSRSFVLRFWRIEEDGGKLKLEEIEPSMTSRESWAPVVLTVKKMEGAPEKEQELDEWGMWKGSKDEEKVDNMFKVTLAYSTPVFPEGWTVGVQEFVVRIPPSSSPLLPIVQRPRVTISARHAIAPSHSYGLFAPARQQQQLVTAIEHSDPFIVTSRSDNTLDVFEVVSAPLLATRPHPHNTIHLRTDAPSKLRVVHRRTLFGHTAGVRSVAIEAGGRCVSGGDDGQVKVWQLGERSMRAIDVVEEEGEAEEPAPSSVWIDLKAKRARVARGKVSRVAQEQPRQQETRPSKIRRLFFDEDKIVSIVEGAGQMESVKVLRFD